MTVPDLGILLIVLPLTGALLTFLVCKHAHWIGAGVALAVNGVLAILITDLIASQQSHRYALGDWGAPLGIELYLDGLSAVMLMMSALTGLGVSLYAFAYFRLQPGGNDQSTAFWPLWLFLWTGLNALFLSADIFNLYVTLELIGLAAVALTALAGSQAALTSAMRYLLISLLGSLCYLLGVALLYHTYATVDLALLAGRINAQPATQAALALMTVGLLLKSALFPLHFWLPPAHGSAAAPVSALLSALVVKASFYLLLRLWLELFHSIHSLMPDLLGWLGAAAILWGSLQALRQIRLKLLIAYSTVAQLGYFFLVFPLAGGQSDEMLGSAWQGGLYMLFAHALAKSAMFLAAGNIQLFGGHDRILLLDRIAQRLPLTLAAFSLAGVSIMGLPPSGGFIGKWLLLEAAIAQERWGYAMVILLGGLLAAAYVFKVIGHAFTQVQTEDVTAENRAVPALMQWSALVLASGSILLGCYPAFLLEWLAIGTLSKSCRPARDCAKLAATPGAADLAVIGARHFHPSGKQRAHTYHPEPVGCIQQGWTGRLDDLAYLPGAALSNPYPFSAQY